MRFLPILLAGLLLSACVSDTLDLENRGNAPIPRGLLAEMHENGMDERSPVLVRIFKKESELELWKRDETGRYALLKTYPMCRWSGQLGPKTAEGDRQAPEGFYQVTYGRLNPASQYYLSFDLGYPNALEQAKGYTGSALMVHGACSSSGCFAISDESVAEVYAVVREALRAGQPSVQVQSFPFRMTPEKLAAHRNNPNFDFWMDLKSGYDRFEVSRQPPTFTFCEGRYRFGAKRGEVEDVDPLGICPSFEEVPLAVATKTATDVAAMQNMLDEGYSASFAYRDGGMHPLFREVLANKGPDFLSRRTSSTSVPISRPRAALADPYLGAMPLKENERPARQPTGGLAGE